MARRADNPGPEPSKPHRENVPGELDHASAEVDQFEAALVEGADEEQSAVSDAELEREAVSQVGDLDDDGDVDEEDRAMATGREVAPAGRAGSRAAARRPAPGAPTTHGGPRFINFLRACWAELQRVQWPDRRQVGQATAVVLGFVIVAGAYLGLADEVAKRIADLIL